MIHRSAGFVAAAAALLVFLAGCAQAHASASRPPTPTPTPSITSAAAPVPVIPVRCRDLIPLETLQEDIAADVSVRRDESSAPVGWNAVVERQAGVLDCAWGTDERTDSTFDDGLSMTVVADAAAAFGAFAATSGFQTGLSVTVGDRSGIECADGAPICSGDVLAGSTWIEFTYSAKTHGGDLANDVVAVIGGAANRLRDVRATKPAWMPQSDAFTAPDCTAALGVRLTGTRVQAVQPGQGSLRQDAVVAARAHQAGCTWATGPAGASGDSYSMTVLNGGRWAFDALRTNGVGYYGGDPVALAPLAGTDGVLSSCGQACSTVVSYRGSLVLFRATVGYAAADSGEKGAVDGMASRLVASLRSAS